MGKKGAKRSGVAVERAETLSATLADVGDVTHRKMFGGVGLFTAGSMFAIIDSSGALFLKADDSNRARFEDAGAERHGRMPYWSVPADVESDRARLLEWATLSAAVARAG